MIKKPRTSSYCKDRSEVDLCLTSESADTIAAPVKSGDKTLASMNLSGVMRLSHLSTSICPELPDPVRRYTALNNFSSGQEGSRRILNNFWRRTYQNFYTDTLGFQVEPHIGVKDLPHLTCQMRNSLLIWKPYLQDTDLSYKEQRITYDSFIKHITVNGGFSIGPMSKSPAIHLRRSNSKSL